MTSTFRQKRRRWCRTSAASGSPSAWTRPAPSCWRPTPPNSTAWPPGSLHPAWESVAVSLLHAYANPAHELLVADRPAPDRALYLAQPRNQPGIARIRADLVHHHQRRRHADRRRLPLRTGRAAAARAGLAGVPLRRRHGLDRDGQAAPHRHGHVRPGGGRRRLGPDRPAARSAAGAHLRHGRHHHRRVPHRRRRRRHDRHEPERRPPAASADARRANRSAPAVARSCIRAPAASASGHRAPGSSRAPPATAMAARCRPSPTPTLSSAISTPRRALAARSASTSMRPEPRSRRSLPSWASISSRRRSGSCRSPMRRWRGRCAGVTVERGVDGRDCTLLAFGGGGPMHAAGLAENLRPRRDHRPGRIERVLRPWLPHRRPKLPASAIGPLEARRASTRRIWSSVSPHSAAIAMAPLLDAGLALERIELSYVALMRYEAQSDTTAIPFTFPVDPGALRADFQAQHHQLYGYSTNEPTIIQGVRVQARVPSTTQATQPRAGGGHPRRNPHLQLSRCDRRADHDHLS